jgi:hypothetical protein
MIPSGTDIVMRAVGTALAGVSIAFAGYMVAYGGGKVRVVGIEHLAIFAQPRGSTIVASPPVQPPSASGAAVDMAATGSVAEIAPKPQPAARPEIIAARGDRVWVRMDGRIVAVAPGDDFPGLGRVGAIVRRDGGWAVLDDKGATLLTLAGPANGAALFSRSLIFE